MLDRARGAGVEAIVIPGVDLAQRARASDLACLVPRHLGPPELRFAAGAHPEGGVDALDGLAAHVEAARPCAIGELGWDRRLAAPLEDQDAVVDAQLELARQRNLPVILHVVGAHGHALERLARHGPLRGVVHGYSGSAELVARYVTLGLHVGIGPSVLRPNARKPLEAARAVPMERLLVETDAPDQIAEPADVRRVAEAVASARAEPLDSVAAATTRNARALLG